MGFLIEGPKNGTVVQVSRDGDLHTRAIVHELQHHYAHLTGQVYQVIGDEVALNNSTHTLLHLRNDSSTHAMVVSYIRMQGLDLAGGTALPSANTYFQLGTGTTWSSGGTAVTPTNTNRSSGNTADITAYDGSPTVSGTFVEMDRWYLPSEGGEQTYNKHGSIILGKNDTLEIRATTDHTSGIGYCRATFSMIELEN